MALSGRLSLERTNGRPLCPQCRAPMWSVPSQSENTTDDKRTFQCPRCEHSHVEKHRTIVQLKKSHMAC